MNDECERLRARVAELEKDAERYRWMLSTNLGVFMQVGGRVMAGASKEAIDASIDAAMGVKE
jgi:hypothetical protein